MWDAEEGLQDLGALPGSTLSYAYGINASGQIVGNSRTVDGQRAALWEAGVGLQDLNDLIDPNSGWTLTNAVAINSSGQIVGTGVFQNGASQAVFLSPTQP